MEAMGDVGPRLCLTSERSLRPVAGKDALGHPPPAVRRLLVEDGGEAGARVDEAWIGRRLMQASRALGGRLEEEGPQPGAPVVAPLASALIREVGRCLMLGDWSPSAPLSRTRVLWRAPSEVSHRDLAIAFNAMGALVRGHLRNLPGLTVPADRFVLDALRHAAKTLLCLRHALLEGLPPAPWQESFGGLVTLDPPATPHLGA